MKDVVIYTGTYCPYCVKAKALLTRKGVAFQEIDVTDASKREAMIEKSGGRKTIPQIFIGDLHIGGCDDLYALDASGKLEDVLKG